MTQSIVRPSSKEDTTDDARKFAGLILEGSRMIRSPDNHPAFAIREDPGVHFDLYEEGNRFVFVGSVPMVALLGSHLEPKLALSAFRREPGTALEAVANLLGVSYAVVAHADHLYENGHPFEVLAEKLL